MNSAGAEKKWTMKERVLAVLDGKLPDRLPFIDNLLETVGRNPIIFGVGGMVLDNNLIERVAYMAERVEGHPLMVREG